MIILFVTCCPWFLWSGTDSAFLLPVNKNKSVVTISGCQMFVSIISGFVLMLDVKINIIKAH